MRLEAVTSTEPKNFTGKISADSVPVSLEEGQRLNVKVLFNEGGTAHLKTQEGYMLRAKIDANIALTVGEEVPMVVMGQEDGMIYLSLDMGNKKTLQVPANNNTNTTSIPDRQWRAYIQELNQLKLPITEETLLLMQQVQKDNPQLSLEKVAFLAANRIAQEVALVAAASQLLEGGPKTGEMITNLIEMAGALAPEQAETLVKGEAQAILNNVEDGGQAVITAQNLDKMQTNAKIQSVWADWVEAALQSDAGVEEQPVTASGKDIDTSFTKGTLGEEAVAPQRLAQGDAPSSNSVQRAFLSLLMEMTQMENVSRKEIVKLSDMLAGVVKDIGVLNEAEGKLAPKLEQFLDELFVKMEGMEKEGGQQIKKAKEELFLRLTLFKEAVMRSDVAAKNSLADQTQRVLDHVRVLNSIEQFAYMQLPIMMNGQQKTAELYVYKQKKGAKKIDPENVNILLALDFQHMGHVESLISIHEKEISLRVEVPNEKVEAFFKDNTLSLYRLISETGYKLVDTKVAHTTQETSVQTALLSLFQYENSKNAGLDFTI